MLTCREVTEQASEYVDGQMTKRQAFAFRLHLSLCKNCRRFISQFRATISYVKLLPEENSLSPAQTADIVNSVIRKSTSQIKREE